MKIFELGLKNGPSLYSPDLYRGHFTCRVEVDNWEEFNESLKPTIVMRSADFVALFPPCHTFSMAGISHHWEDDRPKTLEAAESEEFFYLFATVYKKLEGKVLIESPRAFFRTKWIENHLDIDFPMRKRQTTTYCQYGDTRMKPTDFFSDLDLQLKDPCKNGAPCHVRAPRGSRSGTQQGRKTRAEKTKMPFDLQKHFEQRILSKEN